MARPTIEKEVAYENAEFGGELGYGESPAIVVIDLQLGETDERFPLGTDLSDVIENTNTLVDIAHERGIPVVWTRVVYKHPEAAEGRGPASMRLTKLPALRQWVEGSDAVEFDARCHVADDDYVLDKQHTSAFQKADLDLDSLFENLGIDTVILTGCSTSGCVRYTANDAITYGYHTIVPDACVGDLSEAVHEHNIWKIGVSLADVRDLDDVSEYLRSV